MIKQIQTAIYFFCFLGRSLYVGVMAEGGAAKEEQLRRQRCLRRST